MHIKSSLISWSRGLRQKFANFMRFRFYLAQVEKRVILQGRHADKLNQYERNYLNEKITNVSFTTCAKYNVDLRQVISKSYIVSCTLYIQKKELFKRGVHASEFLSSTHDACSSRFKSIYKYFFSFTLFLSEESYLDLEMS